MARNNLLTVKNNCRLNNNTWNDWDFSVPAEIFPDINTFFNNFWTYSSTMEPMLSNKSNLPKTNSFVDDNGLTIECLIPFAKREDINVELDPVVNTVTIDVKSHQVEGRKYNLQEISRTSFKRSFFLDKKFDLKNADAKFEDAILTITFPYCVENKKKNLEIK